MACFKSNQFLLQGEGSPIISPLPPADANALNGSIYTSLGSLYYQVPGWPLGFGDDDKAHDYLKKALAAPSRPDRSIADAGRKKEINIALAKALAHVQ